VHLSCKNTDLKQLKICFNLYLANIYRNKLPFAIFYDLLFWLLFKCVMAERSKESLGGVGYPPIFRSRALSNFLELLRLGRSATDAANTVAETFGVSERSVRRWNSNQEQRGTVGNKNTAHHGHARLMDEFVQALALMYLDFSQTAHYFERARIAFILETQRDYSASKHSKRQSVLHTHVMSKVFVVGTHTHSQRSQKLNRLYLLWGPVTSQLALNKDCVLSRLEACTFDTDSVEWYASTK